MTGAQGSLPLDPAIKPASLPPGILYRRDILSLDDEQVIRERLDMGEWSTVLKRRVQHFGYLYDYRARAVTAEAYLGPLPDWLQSLGERLCAEGVLAAMPDQVIANEYLPGQGISAHVDCVPCFGEAIVSISLLSPCEMIFRERSSARTLPLLLEPRSCLLLTGAGRYDWTHEIPARKSDFVGGVRVERGRRISLTFRKIIQAAGSTSVAMTQT